MIAKNQKNAPLEQVEHTVPFFSTTEAEIAEMEHDVAFLYHSVPAIDESFVHFIHTRKRAVAIADGICMVEMSVGGEPDVLGR